MDLTKQIKMIRFCSGKFAKLIKFYCDAFLVADNIEGFVIVETMIDFLFIDTNRYVHFKNSLKELIP